MDCKKTQLFKKSRQEHRTLEQSMLDKKMQYLDECIRKREASNTGIVGQLFRVKAKNSTMCMSCGQLFNLFSKGKPCGHCKLLFCVPCLTQGNIELVKRLGRVNPQETITEFYECERCALKFRVAYKSIEHQKLQEEAESNPIHKLYNQLQFYKNRVERLFPKYEYLAASICDQTFSSTGNPLNDTSKIFEDVVTLERQLIPIFNDLKEGLKRLSLLQTTTEKQEVLKNNLRVSILAFFEGKLPAFNLSRHTIKQVELDVMCKAYRLVRKIWALIGSDNDVLSRYGKLIQNAAKHIRNEIQQATLESGANWEEWKAKLDQKLDDEKRKQGIFETIVLRRVIDTVRQGLKLLDMRVGGLGAPVTRKVFDALLHLFETDRDNNIKCFLDGESL